SGQTAGLTDWPIERIAQTVEPNDAQRAVLDELKAATAQALDILKAACPAALPSTPTGRIEAMHQRLGAMLEAVRTVRPVVEKFYQSLNDEQKARFNALGPEDNPDQQQAQRNLTQVCGERASGIASLPLERIERAVQPDGAQRSALKDLQDATSEAVNLLTRIAPPIERSRRSAACKRWSNGSMRCCAPCKPSSPRSRSFTDLSATSKRSASIGSAPRRADTAKAAFHSEGDREVALTPSSRSYIGADLSAVIAGRDPAIHPLERSVFFRWMPGSSPGMTS